MLDLPLWHIVLLTSAGFLAGAANAIAGGGTFISFPVFLAIGLPPVIANASNAVAVWPGHALATIGYRHVLQDVRAFLHGRPDSALLAKGLMQLRHDGLLLASALAALGGATGAYALVKIGNGPFVKMVPFLLLAATMLFAFAPVLTRSLRKVSGQGMGVMGLAGIFIFSVYGGFFGAGFAIMMMAGLMFLGVQDPQHNNALKNLLGMIVTSISVGILSFTGLVAWSETLWGLVGATVGGLIGAKFAKRIPVRWLRMTVIAIGVTLTVSCFIHYY